ncbi:hypothetical protein GCM10027203_44750 [Nonomuraea fastidiosa]
MAVAYCVSTHSAQFGAQMPTRSPLAMPRASRPSATSFTAASNSAYVHRRPVAISTSASLSGCRATVRSRFAPIVSPSRGTSETPDAYESSESPMPEASVSGGGRASP